MTKLSPDERSALRQYLEQRFSLSELKDLAFDLGVDYESFRHNTQVELSRALIANLEPRDSIGFLLAEVVSRRADVPDTLSALALRVPSSRPREKVQIIIAEDREQFTSEQQKALLLEIASKLGIDPGAIELIGVTRGSVVVSLEMPEESAQLLVSMYLSGDSTLKHLQIKKVGLQQEALHSLQPNPNSQSNPENVVAQPETLLDIQNPKFRARLRKNIDTYFNEDDIRTICYDLSIDYESISGESKSAKIRELLAFCERKGNLEDFINSVRQERPNILW